LGTIIVEFDVVRLRKRDREWRSLIALGLGRKMRRKRRIPAATKFDRAFIHVVTASEWNDIRVLAASKDHFPR
jgi:hypothetical protein